MTTDYEIRVGKNARDNWRLIDEAEGDDLWFHVEEYPSAHVILRYPHARKELRISDYEKEHVNQCCRILIEKCPLHGKVVIIATLVKNLLKKGHVGTVELVDSKDCIMIRGTYSP